MITRLRFGAYAAAVAGLIAAACGTSTVDDESVCVAGDTQSCDCDSGGTGEQLCNEDGTGFEPCMCDGSGGTGGSGGSGTGDGGPSTGGDPGDGGAGTGGASGDGGPETDGAAGDGSSATDGAMPDGSMMTDASMGDGGMDASMGPDGAMPGDGGPVCDRGDAGGPITLSADCDACLREQCCDELRACAPPDSCLAPDDAGISDLQCMVVCLGDLAADGGTPSTGDIDGCSTFCNDVSPATLDMTACFVGGDGGAGCLAACEF